ncbi:folate family ECF transporter S component [uncultured Dialister sp.]|uniref:folate family ECF transporter S component n=1 Tax=uncultured Dialister sp. TaxID=278064 RepID=UPI00258F425A|nr:folate family ECF transporter S component [uncultured Dialister sp.]
MHKNREKEMVVLGILTALAVLLSYVFAIQTPFVRITFGFLPLALAGALYGPWKAGLVGALDNLIGTALVGTSIFFPGFTLSDFLTGFIFGYFFYRKEITFPYVCIPFLVIMVLIHLGLNTLWLVLYYDKAASAIFLGRLIKNLICFPMEVGLFLLIYKKAYRWISLLAVGR